MQSADLKIPREAKILFLDWRSVASWSWATQQNNLPISVLNAAGVDRLVGTDVALRFSQCRMEAGKSWLMCPAR